jgi:RNA polymerase sigma-70 factor (ECF subfamily)
MTRSSGLGLARWLPRLRARPAEDDWALWRRACAGEAAAASTLVQRLTPQALGLARQLLRSAEDAEDMVQESFLRLWGSRPSEARGAALATFFNTIVINRCKTLLGQRRELATEPEMLEALAEGRPPAGTEARADRAALLAALGRLPARQRMALAMWAFADAEVPEIARALALEPNAAHQLLHRAKQALRRQLAPEDDV